MFWPSRTTQKMRRLKTEAMKFSVVGAANFLLTLAVFTVTLKVMHWNYLLSLAIAWGLGMCFSYVVNFSWVFKPEQKLVFNSRFLKFFSASLISIVINLIVLRLVVEGTGFDPFMVQLALIPLIVIFNFATAKFWSLKSGTAGL